MGRIHIGIGGWVYEPWRGTFYPEGLSQKRELAHASAHLSSIEINGTYYGSQKPESFARWHDETPEDFVFALKAPRFATNRKVLAESGASIERFFTSGVMQLRDKLGPVNWQFLPTKQFDPEDFAAFLDLLPESHEGRRLRHAVEVRHDSFRDPDFVQLCRNRGVAIVLAGDSDHPQIADPTADFVYARIMGTEERFVAGYAPQKLDHWAARAKDWAEGRPDGLDRMQSGDSGPRDVFLYVISGFKERNPLAAMELIRRID